MTNNFYQQPVATMSNIVVYVQNEQEFLNYPVAPGNTVIFMNAKEKCFYTKSMSFSQYDKPHCEKYSLDKEAFPEQEQTPAYVTQEEFNKLVKELESLKTERKNYNKRKEDRSNEQHG